ncbi:nuclear transport factor 2 family protein [Bacillus sp. 2205SS5-2]|uniref:nuclear transport factor 2 family protein n=1 Tax=Bacillus sp. 2205SS5-2 TaxID=3109031 RepID=UPI0030043B70
MKKDQLVHGKLSNREKALSFLQLVVSRKVREAFLSHISPDFCHHNPYFQGDADSIMLAMEEDGAKNPDKIFEVKRVLEERETVVVYSHVKQNPKDLGVAVVHIFRFQDDLIVEMWDVGQPIPEASPNENGMF